MNDTERTLALAGIFQSAGLVDRLAQGESICSKAYNTSISSIFVLNPKDLKEIFGQPENLEVGFSLLKDVLNKRSLANNQNTVRYAISLMHIQSILNKDEDTLSTLRHRLQQCIGRTEYFDSNIHPTVIANLADIYVDTMGSFRYRIQVKGDPNILQQAANANKVRAIFLAGVRSAMLWNQLGGRRMQLIFSRKRLLTQVTELSG